MANIELPDMKPAVLTPTLLIGAASPLWGYFGAATVGGLAYWWMARLANPANLETIFGGATDLPAPVEMVLEPVVEAVEATAEVVVAVCEAATDALTSDMPVGGESAPLSPMAAEPEPDIPAIETLTDDLTIMAAPATPEVERKPIPEPEAQAVEATVAARPSDGAASADSSAEEPVARPIRVRAKKPAPADEG